MAYEYIQRAYGVLPVVGAGVRHTVTGRYGIVARENRSQSHYVQVRFIGKKFALPCHPQELEYGAVPPAAHVGARS